MTLDAHRLRARVAELLLVRAQLFELEGRHDLAATFLEYAARAEADRYLYVGQHVDPILSIAVQDVTGATEHYNEAKSILQSGSL